LAPIALRPRTTTELIDASFNLLRHNYLEIITATALFNVPVLILRSIGMPEMQPFAFGQVPNVGFGSDFFSRLVLVSLGAFILGSISNAVTVVIVSDNYLGRDVTIASALSRVMPRIVPIVIGAFLTAFLSTLGFFFFIIGVLIVYAWLFATVSVIVVEGKGPLEALGRSRFLARGSVGKIIGTIALGVLIVWLIAVVFSLIVGALSAMLPMGAQILTFAGYAVAIFVSPFFLVVQTLLYFDLRVRKDRQLRCELVDSAGSRGQAKFADGR